MRRILTPFILIFTITAGCALLTPLDLNESGEDMSADANTPSEDQALSGDMAPIEPPRRAISCNRNAPCVCNAGERCAMTCPPGGCSMICEVGADCQITCQNSSRACDISCKTGATCDTTCDQARCSLTCESGATCDTSCQRGTCSTECSAPGAQCTLDCTAGDCSCDGEEC